MPDRVKPSSVIFDIRALAELQSARMSEITINDGLTRPDRVKPSSVIFDIRALAELQSARMSEITINDG